MPDKNRYPQIPSTVWWGVRAILNRTPNTTIDERALGVQLSVQAAAAKAYIKELKQVGIITEEGKATPLAQRWKLDESYAEATKDIINATYPQGLVDIAPPGDAERQKIISWFQRAGLGEGSAGNKAATYLLLSSITPNEAPKASAKSSSTDNLSRARPARRQPAASQSGNASEMVASQEGGEKSKSPHLNRSAEAFPLNVNVQIHISADAGTEQIESIFQAMRRYLYEPQNS